MRNICLGWIILWAFVSTLGCRASSPDWNGTWTLNPVKGSFQGSVSTISISADGEYHYEDGASSFTFRCDGQYRSIGNNRTEACVQSSPTVLDITREENGVRINAYHWELSSAEKVLTVTATAFRPSGPVITIKIIASRMTGSNGFAGQWRDPSYLQRHADMTLRLDGQTLNIGYPNMGQYIRVKLDGTDATVEGPNPQGATYTARLAGQRELQLLAKRNGKVLLQISLDLSRDGRVITYSWWNPDRPAVKGMLIYEKK